MIAPTRDAAPRAARPGMRGGVVLRAELVAGRTRITDLVCRPPLQILRAHHVDRELSGLASVILASPSGGILQGDELTIDIRVGPGARLRVLTQSATRIYRSPADEAYTTVHLEVDEEGCLEYLPHQIIPFSGSRFRSRATFVVAQGGSLIAWEVIAPGRAARGEIFAFDRFESGVEIVRPDGTLLATDMVVLDRAEAIRAVGVLGTHLVLGTLFVVRSGATPGTLRDAIGDTDVGRVTLGASSLPNGAGAWIRVLGDRPDSVAPVLVAAWRAARFGAPTPSGR